MVLNFWGIIWRFFAIYAKEVLCKIALITSESTDYDFFLPIFIALSKFWRKAFTIIIGFCNTKQAREW